MMWHYVLESGAWSLLGWIFGYLVGSAELDLFNAKKKDRNGNGHG